MKRTIVFPALALLLLMGAQSCKKHELESVVEEQTIDGTIAANEKYVVTLPASASGEPYAITTQALHASSSQLSTNSLGQTLLTYVPSADFTGTDMLVVENSQEPPADKPRCGNHKEDRKPKCDKHRKRPEAKRRIMIKVKIVSRSTRNK